MAQSTCFDISEVGPFQQTLFLGSSIMSFTTSIGWNSAVSTLTVQLVTDPCPGNKLYYTDKLEPMLWTSADPGFFGLNQDIVGCPVYFRMANFEFSGIIQSWEEFHSTSGNPTYTVQITDPRELLEKSQLIIGSYAGSVNGAYNIFNLFGYAETFGEELKQKYLKNTDIDGSYEDGDLGIDGCTFGSPAQAFGGSQTNQLGISWNRITGIFNILINGIQKSSNQWSPYGRICFKGATISGCGLLGADTQSNFDQTNLSEYLVDLTDLPTPPSYWRLSGITTSILSVITQLCEDAGYDFYIEMLPIKNSSMYANSGIAKIIKVRTAHRLNQPVLGTIQAFTNPVGSLDSSYGCELRNETTTSIVIGGNKETLYQAYKSWGADTILPFIGVDFKTKNTIIPTLAVHDPLDEDSDPKWSHGTWKFILDASQFNAKLKNAGGPDDIKQLVGTIAIYEYELMAALSGFDVWLNWIIQLDTDTAYAINNKTSFLNINTILEAVTAEGDVDIRLLPPHIFNKKMKNAVKIARDDKAADRYWEEAHMLHEWVKGFADKFGKYFQISVPYSLSRIDDDSAKVISSDEPMISGWTNEEVVLGMHRDNPRAFLLQSDDNKILSTIVFNDAVDDAAMKDISKIPEDDCILVDNQTAPHDTNKRIFVKASVQNEYVYENYANKTNPRAILTIPEAVLSINNINSHVVNINGIFKLLDVLLEENDGTDEFKEKCKVKLAELLKGVGTKEFYMPYPYTMDTFPYGASFGIKNNLMTYGPWINLGPAGGVKLEQEAGLVPWEYNGMVLLNTVGQSKADAGVTKMQVGEKGNIKVPGYPTVPLGSELGASSNGFFGPGQQLVDNRMLTIQTWEDMSYAVFNSGGKWQGLYGPNITNISIDFTSQGITTTYTMRTYTQKVGAYSKSFIDRYSIMAKKAQTLKAESKDRNKLKFDLKEAKAFRDGRNILRVTVADIMGKPATPHANLVAMPNAISGSPFSMTTVTTQSHLDLYNEIDEYTDKAFMSLDGLLRPVSYTAKDGWPVIANAINSNSIKNNAGLPPMMTGINNGGVHGLPITRNFLDPFLNPNSEGALRSDGDGTIGHDIVMAGRDTDLQDSITIPTTSGTMDYKDDYRILALRGPLLIHGWGYDLDGKPVPNASGDSGDNVSEKFLSGWLRRSETWPVGPLDLRWDRDRGVWTSPPPYTLIMGKLIQDLHAGATGSAIFTMAKQQKLYGGDGTELVISTDVETTPKVEVVNTYSYSMESGANVLLSYDTRFETGKYRIVEGDPAQTIVVKLTTGMLYNTTDISGELQTSDDGSTWTSVRKIGVRNGMAGAISERSSTSFGPTLANGYGIAAATYTNHEQKYKGFYYQLVSADMAARFASFKAKTLPLKVASSFDIVDGDDDGSTYVTGVATILTSWDGQEVPAGDVSVAWPITMSGSIGIGVTGIGSIWPTQTTLLTNLWYKAISVNSSGVGLRGFNNTGICLTGTSFTDTGIFTSLAVGNGLTGTKQGDGSTLGIGLHIAVTGADGVSCMPLSYGSLYGSYLAFPTGSGWTAKRVGTCGIELDKSPFGTGSVDVITKIYWDSTNGELSYLKRTINTPCWTSEETSGLLFTTEEC